MNEIKTNAIVISKDLFIYFICLLVGFFVLQIFLGICSSPGIFDYLDEENVKIACVGDSITSGSYPKELARLIEGKGQVKVFAAEGIDLKAIQRLSEKSLQWDPDYIVLYGGINDCMRDAGDKVFLKIHSIVNYLEKAGVKVIVVNHHPWKSYNLSGWNCSKVVNEWLRNDNSKNVVDTSEMGVDGVLKREFDAGDGLHLDKKGNEKLAELVFSKLEEMKDGK
jgi:lysophospholipase L1-like esterase